jgi:hypothetical protein
MLLSNSILALVAALACQVQAKDKTQCYTAMTNKKPAGYPPTKWSTHYSESSIYSSNRRHGKLTGSTAPCTTTVYSTKLTTSTPKVTKTETVKSYTTVTDPKKKVSTTTKTVTASTGTVVTTTSTVTASTSIDATKSITNPAPAVFTPVQSSLPGASFEPFQGADVPKRSVESIEERNSPPQGYGLGKTYPKQVTCHKYSKDKHCVTKKVTKTKTITAKPYTVTVKV